MRTPVQHLADLLLDQRVEEWVRERRTRTPKVSWHRIAIELREVTKGKVDVTPTTLITWDTADQERASA